MDKLLETVEIRAMLWWTRLIAVRSLPIEALYIGLAVLSIVVGYMGPIPHFPILSYTMFSIGAFTIAAYLDNRPRAMIAACFGQVAVWIFAAAYLFLQGVGHGIPAITLTVGMMFVWVSSRLTVIHVQRKHEVIAHDTVRTVLSGPMKIVFKQ